MKEKLIKLLFPELSQEIKALYEVIDEQNTYIRELQETPTVAEVMKEALGISMIDFANTDKDGSPPHYLENLSEDQRKAFIGEMSNIYMKPEFHTVLNYWINMFGNHAIRSDDSQAGRYGINGVVKVRKSFEAANKEFVELNKEEEEEEDEDL